MDLSLCNPQLNRVNEEVPGFPHNKVSLKGALATFFFFLTILGIGNVVVDSYCRTELMRNYGRIAVRFLSCIVLISICIRYFKIQISATKSVAIGSRIIKFLLSCIFGFVLFLFVLSENALEVYALSQFNAARALQLWLAETGLQDTRRYFDLQLMIGLFVACFIAPLAEEIFFRGLLFRALRIRFTTRVSILLVAFIFVLAHLQNPYVVGTVIFSISLSLIYINTKSLWPCIYAHGSFNLCSFSYENYFGSVFMPLLGRSHVNETWTLLSGLLIGSSILLIFFFYSIGTIRRQKDSIMC